MAQKRRKKTGQKVSQNIASVTPPASAVSPEVIASPELKENSSDSTEKQCNRGGYDDGYDVADMSPHMSKKMSSVSSVSQEKTSQTAYVHKNILYIAIIGAFVVGLFVGTLLPNTARENTHNGNTLVHSNNAVPKQAETSVAAPEVTSHILALEEAVRKNPKDVAAWIQLGNHYFDTQKPSAAIHAYEHALEAQPDNANVLTDLGIMYRAIGQFEKAVQAFSTAFAIDARHEQALFNTGIVLYYDLGRKVEGRQAWEKLLRINAEARAPNGVLLKEMLNNID